MGGGVYHTGLPYNTFAYEYPEGPNHYNAILGSFAECVRNHIKPYVNIEMHQNNMKAVNACYESIYTGKKIML
jgi:predicted dehydrogenase